MKGSSALDPTEVTLGWSKCCTRRYGSNPRMEEGGKCCTRRGSATIVESDNPNPQ